MNTKLQFKVDPERIELGELIDMQDGNIKAMRDLLAHCLTNGNGEFMTDDEARKLVNKLKLSEIKNTVAEFVKQLGDKALPSPISSD